MSFSARDEPKVGTCWAKESSGVLKWAQGVQGVYEGATKSKWVQEQALLPVGHLGSGLHHVSGPKGPGPGEGGQDCPGEARCGQVGPG